MSRSAKPVVGLVGGVGSGKTAVAEVFADLGAGVIDADRMAHEVLAEPDVRDAVARRWGPRVCGPDGRIDRARLARVVFADPDDGAPLKELEAILHPRITARMHEQVARPVADPDVPLIVLDAPVLLEAGWDKYCGAIVYVHAPQAVRLGRVLQARHWKKEELEQRERQQKPLNLKKACADYEVDNSGSPEDCRRQVERLVHDLTDD